MTFKYGYLSSLLILTMGLAVRAQFTPGAGGTYAPTPPAQPRPVVPVPTNPPGSSSPTYSWETPAQPAPAPIYGQPALTPSYPQPAQPPVVPQGDMVRIVSGPQVINGIEYIPTPQGYIPRLSDAQVGDLTASVALYPDPLLSIILPASTYVEQLTYAEKWMTQHPGADDRAIDNLPIDDSVKSLMHYPTVLSMMTDHLDWTQAVGLSFLYQRDDLMESVQRWRSLAVTYGTLASTPQQDVFRQGSTIFIVPPPQAQTVYVPTYDPRVVYVRPVRPVPVQNIITFSAGGFSLSFIDNDLDWRGHTVRVPNRPHDWDHDHDGPGRGGDRGGPGDGRGGGGDRGDRGGRGRGTDTGGRGDPGRSGGGSDRGGRGASVLTTPEKTPFVHDAVKPGIKYPDKIATPQADKKVVTIPAATKPVPPLTMPAIPIIPAPGRGLGGGR